MDRKEKLLKEVEKDVVEQEKDKEMLESSDAIPGNEVDPIAAPGVDAMEELDKGWKKDEKEMMISESDEEVDAGLGIEEEEEKGEEPYPEIEEVLDEDPDSIDEEDDMEE